MSRYSDISIERRENRRLSTCGAILVAGIASLPFWLLVGWWTVKLLARSIY